MPSENPLKIGITCHPTVGGSGVLASALGEELARRGHEVHFISYQRPFRLPAGDSPIRFHRVGITDYGLFKYPDYTLPLSVKMAEVSRDFHLDVLHVHYAVPHATAAILARSMLPADSRPRLVTTLHGTDTTLLGRDADYGPAIRHALECSDAITAVSSYLRLETLGLFAIDRPIEMIHNFFSPRPARRSPQQVRQELGLRDEVMVLHCSNLRPVKRIDLLLETVARIRPRESFKLVILAGEDFSPFQYEVQRLGLVDRIIVRHKVSEIEDYLQELPLKRKAWFDRADLQLARLQFYEAQGLYVEDVRYSDYQDFQGVNYPSHIEVVRPIEDYRLAITILKATFNQPIDPEKFVLTQPPGTQLIDLARKEEKPSGQ